MGKARFNLIVPSSKNSQAPGKFKDPYAHLKRGAFPASMTGSSSALRLCCARIDVAKPDFLAHSDPASLCTLRPDIRVRKSTSMLNWRVGVLAVREGWPEDYRCPLFPAQAGPGVRRVEIPAAYDNDEGYIIMPDLHIPITWPRPQSPTPENVLRCLLHARPRNHRIAVTVTLEFEILSLKSPYGVIKVRES